MVEGGRFELPNPMGADLQSAAFSHFATPPIDYVKYKWWLRTESNRRHKDFQSFALPTELLSRFYMAIRTGLEPATSSVTGWHSNQLNYRTVFTNIYNHFFDFINRNKLLTIKNWLY